jgi:hypothetical protein
MPILGKTEAGLLIPITNGVYTMAYYTKEQLLTLLINDIKYWSTEEGYPYSVKYTEILQYAGTTLPPYWLEEKVVEEIGLLLTHLNEFIPNFVINYKSMLSIQVYQGISDYYSGI